MYLNTAINYSVVFIYFKTLRVHTLLVGSLNACMNDVMLKNGTPLNCTYVKVYPIVRDIKLESAANTLYNIIKKWVFTATSHTMIYSGKFIATRLKSYTNTTLIISTRYLRRIYKIINIKLISSTLGTHRHLSIHNNY